VKNGELMAERQDSSCRAARLRSEAETDA
jgi:hypothetical protein